MKKRIDTLLYDTDTAKKIASYEAPYPRSDIQYYEEELYKKRTGEYFLYGSGNARSPYAEQVYGETSAWEDGEKIVPLSYEEAQKWFEKANNENDELATDEVYEKEFGTIKSDTSKKEQQIFRLSKTAIQKVERMEQKQGKTKSEIVENLIMSE